MEDLRESDPRVMGSYRLWGRIGSGGMGVVYLGSDGHGRRVAVKRVRPELVDDPASRARFRREVEAARRVSGFCTARCLDADLESDPPYLVSEFVAHGSLHDYVIRYGRLSGDRLLWLAIGLAEALVAMEAVGVVHRDLKPSNILLSPSGPKVVDFGISHAAGRTSLTRAGSVLGSPGWMAPEQAMGQPATAAADVFSWGAIVVFAATGRSAFGRGPSEAVLYRVVHEEPELDGLDPRLHTLVGQALQKDPFRRPSPRQLLADVVGTVAWSGPRGSQVPTTEPAGRPRSCSDGSRVTAPAGRHRRRRSMLVALAALVLVAAAIGATAALVQRHLQSPGPGHGRVSGVGGRTNSAGHPARPGGLVSASLPLQVCAAGYSGGAAPTASPADTTELVPRDMQGELGVYTDEQGGMELIGPSGWTCTATYGSDGGGGITLYPSDETLPGDGSGAGNAVEVISGWRTSYCLGCGETQACPLFPAAAADYANDYGMSCPGSRPSAESVQPIEDGVVGFLDPAGVPGDGAYSGGAFPAHGVMTYHAGNDGGSWEDTCVLPPSRSAVCAAVLDNFVQSYGSG